MCDSCVMPKIKQLVETFLAEVLDDLYGIICDWVLAPRRIRRSPSTISLPISARAISLM
jgi:hypothetical protein